MRIDSGIPCAPWAPPLLRWAGSKRKLLPLLMAYSPSEFKRYVEPFAGSACLFFALRPRQAILGDINAELLETYSTVRSHPRLVARKARSWNSSRTHYYAIRRRVPQELQPVERAARFVYLNRRCFNGVYRTNRRGAFNVPRGVRTGRFPDERTFYRCSVALRGTEFRSGDFENCLSDVRKGDFVYLDPPYSVTRPRFGEYGYGCFGDPDLERLAACLKRIDSVGATFLVSYSDSGEFRDLIQEWNCITLRVRRHVAGFARHRATVSEILASNKVLNKAGS